MLYVKRRLSDGTLVIADDPGPGEWVVLPADWVRVQALPPEQRLDALKAAVAANRADPTGGRSERDEQAMDTARDASSGEAHQESEK